MEFKESFFQDSFLDIDFPLFLTNGSYLSMRKLNESKPENEYNWFEYFKFSLSEDKKYLKNELKIEVFANSEKEDFSFNVKTNFEIFYLNDVLDAISKGRLKIISKKNFGEILKKGLSQMKERF